MMKSKCIVNNSYVTCESLINFELLNKIDAAYEKYANKIFTLENFTDATNIYLRDSIKLNYIARSKFDKFSKYINYFISIFDNKYNSKLNKHDIEALKVFVSNLIYSAQCDFKPINYSRNRIFFTELSGRNIWLKYTNYMRIVNFFENEDYFYNFNWFFNKENPDNRMQSRMLPSKKFVTEIINIDDYIAKKMIDMHEDKQKIPVLIFKLPKRKTKKGDDKKFYEGTTLKDVVLTDELKREQKKIKAINEALNKHNIELDITDKEMKDLRKRCSVNPDLKNIWYRRIYNNCVKGSSGKDLVRFGGRLFDETCNLPKEYRKHITINGNKTLELDFSNTHPSLIYATNYGIIPDGDLYQVDADLHVQFKDMVGVELRPILKTILASYINMDKDSYKRYIYSIIYDKIYEELYAIDPIKYYYYCKPKQKVNNNLTKSGKPKKRINYNKKLRGLNNQKCNIPFKRKNGKTIIDLVIERFEEKHQQIFNLDEDNLGYTCFKKESDICLKIMDEFILKRNIPLLQIYDSFVIEAQYKDDLQQIMIKAFQEVTQTNCIPSIH